MFVALLILSIMRQKNVSVSFNHASVTYVNNHLANNVDEYRI